MLIGEYEGKLTDKNRIALPKKCRENLDGKIYVTRGYENCLIILDESRWEKLIKQIEIKPFLNKTVRDTKRFIIGGASEISLDNQGRFLLNSSHIEYASIKHSVVFVGIMDWLEIWSMENWNIKLLDLKESASEIAERLIS